MMVTGKRYQVFSIKETIEDKEKKSVWVKAGSAFVNRDGSINVYLDVLPLDGKLHVREPLEDRRTVNNNNSNTSQTNGSSAQQSNNNEVGVGV
ncbi:MAG: hypothetical protein ACO1OB_30680 [Archangium sp.]